MSQMVYILNFKIIKSRRTLFSFKWNALREKRNKIAFQYYYISYTTTILCQLLYDLQCKTLARKRISAKFTLNQAYRYRFWWFIVLSFTFQMLHFVQWVITKENENNNAKKYVSIYHSLMRYFCRFFICRFFYFCNEKSFSKYSLNVFI